MIGKKIVALTLATTMLLTACGQSTDSLESFYKKIEKANKEGHRRFKWKWQKQKRKSS